MAKEKIEKTEAKGDSAEIVYVPQAGDPTIVKWNGITFHANVPVSVDRTKGYRIPVPTERILPTGQQGKDFHEKFVSLVDMAKTNPSFRVDGEQAERKRATDRTPETPEQYRGYAHAWIADSTDLASVQIRWKAEEAMRQACGVDANDVAYIKPFLDYKVSLLGGASAVR